MKAEIKNGILTIEMPVYAEPVLSSSGGTKLIANSGGFQVSNLQVGGLPVFVSASALIKPPELESVRKANRARK